MRIDVCNYHTDNDLVCKQVISLRLFSSDKKLNEAMKIAL